jgi:hypothetical protein
LGKNWLQLVIIVTMVSIPIVKVITSIEHIEEPSASTMAVFKQLSIRSKVVALGQRRIIAAVVFVVGLVGPMAVVVRQFVELVAVDSSHFSFVVIAEAQTVVATFVVIVSFGSTKLTK